jgi:hypothetical protein
MSTQRHLTTKEVAERTCAYVGWISLRSSLRSGMESAAALPDSTAETIIRRH